MASTSSHHSNWKKQSSNAFFFSLIYLLCCQHPSLFCLSFFLHFMSPSFQLSSSSISHTWMKKEQNSQIILIPTLYRYGNFHYTCAGINLGKRSKHKPQSPKSSLQIKLIILCQCAFRHICRITLQKLNRTELLKSC